MFYALKEARRTTTIDDKVIIDDQIQEILLSKYKPTDQDIIASRFENEDVLNIYYAIKELKKELGYMELENMVSVHFLEKNDPKLLIGITKALDEHSSIKVTTKLQFIDEQDKSSQTKKNEDSVSKGSSTVLTKLNASQTSSLVSFGTRPSSAVSALIVAGGGGHKEQQLNFKIKAELTEKLYIELRQEFDNIKMTSYNHIKSLKANIEELQYRRCDILGTIKAFKDVILVNYTDPKTGRIPSEKFIKYFINWIKNAAGLLSNMRLKIQTLHELCSQLRTTIIKKADLRGMLQAVDFDLLKIKKDEYTRTLETQALALYKIKKIMGRGSTALSRQRNLLFNMEHQSLQLHNKIMEYEQTCKKMENECELVEVEVIGIRDNIYNLEDQIKKQAAPSVFDYIDQKQRVIVLEREEKSLTRKIDVLKLKYKNTRIKLKQQELRNKTNG